MKPLNYIALSVAILAASLLGFWILFFVFPDVTPLTIFERGLWIVALVLMLPTLPLIVPAAFVLPPGTEIWTTVIFSLISALLWPLLVGLIGRRLRRKGAEPNA